MSYTGKFSSITVEKTYHSARLPHCPKSRYLHVTLVARVDEYRPNTGLISHRYNAIKSIMGSKLRRCRRAASKDRAWCPFKVARVSAPHDEDPKQQIQEYASEREELMQQSPFYPEGSFNTRKTMNLSYLVEPCKRWRNMTRYKSFIRKCFQSHYRD
jgi:hypothetical protein